MCGNLRYSFVLGNVRLCGEILDSFDGLVSQQYLRSDGLLENCVHNGRPSNMEITVCKSYFLKDRYNVSNPLPSISHRKICKLLLNLLTHQYHPFSSEIFELCLLPFLFNRNLFVATKLDQYGKTTYAKYKTLRGPIGARLCYKNQDAF